MADKKNFKSVQFRSDSPKSQRKTPKYGASSFDDTNLLVASRRGAQCVLSPERMCAAVSGGSNSTKFSRAQSFGDKLLWNAPKFAKSKKILHVAGTADVLPNSDNVATGHDDKFKASQHGRSDAWARGPDLTVYCDEMLELKRYQRIRLRHRSTSICVEKWNESFDGR